MRGIAESALDNPPCFNRNWTEIKEVTPVLVHLTVLLCVKIESWQLKSNIIFTLENVLTVILTDMDTFGYILVYLLSIYNQMLFYMRIHRDPQQTLWIKQTSTFHYYHNSIVFHRLDHKMFSVFENIHINTHRHTNICHWNGYLIGTICKVLQLFQPLQILSNY